MDDLYYFISAVHHNWRRTGNAGFSRSSAQIYSGEIELAELCQRVYDMVPHDPVQVFALPATSTRVTQRTLDFAIVCSRAGILFPSDLKFVAAKQLIEMFRTADKAVALRRDVLTIREAISATFLRSPYRKGEVWLNSATGVGRQPDVLGQRFRLLQRCCGSADFEKIGRALARAYWEKLAVRERCVRSVLSNDPANPHGWQRSVSPPGTYQNGGYWALLWLGIWRRSPGSMFPMRTL